MDLENLTAIIIDDEPEAINLLTLYLRHFPLVTVVGTETNAKKGLTMVGEILPELVFLDIDMPQMNGLQVASSIHSENFHSEIVFTTAHQHYAYEAIGVEPLDFLTKPYCIEDLEIVLQKYKTKTGKKKLELKMDKFVHAQSNQPKLKLPANHGIVLVDIKDIVIIRSKANKSVIHLQDGTMETINKSISKLIEILNSSFFFKCHRTTYINLNFLTRVDKKNNKCFLAFNQTTQEEAITKDQIIHLEKLELYPV